MSGFPVSWSLLKLMSIKSVMPSNHLILCHPLLFLLSTFPNIRAFSSELALHIRWPKYWSFNVTINPSGEYSGLIYFRIDCKGLSRVFSSTTVQKYQFFSAQPSLLSHFSCGRFCNPIDGSPPGSLVPGILQARTLEWVAIAFSKLSP